VTLKKPTHSKYTLYDVYVLVTFAESMYLLYGTSNDYILRKLSQYHINFQMGKWENIFKHPNNIKLRLDLVDYVWETTVHSLLEASSEGATLSGRNFGGPSSSSSSLFFHFQLPPLSSAHFQPCPAPFYDAPIRRKRGRNKRGIDLPNREHRKI
jgi:hypothetical protein